MQLDYEDSGGFNNMSGYDDFGGTSLSTQPQGALSAATQTEPKVNELLYDPTLINEPVQQPKFGGSFENLFPTTPSTPVTPAPLSTPQFNFNGDPLYGSDPVGFDPNNLGFVADQATPNQTVPNTSTIGNPFASLGALDLNAPFKLPYNPTVSPPTTPDEQKQFDDYWAANPIDLGPNFMRNTFAPGFDLNGGGLRLNSPEEQIRLNNLDKIIDPLTQQILGQGLTDKWSGQGHGSADANARDMAKILAGIGITDIKQFGKFTKTGINETVTSDGRGGFVDQRGNPVDPKLVTSQMAGESEGGYYTEYIAPVGTQEVFGNKLTKQEVPNTYSERQTGNFFGGTFEGKGNTGYGVQFDEQGNPYFYTQGASSSDLGKLAPFLAIAQFIPGLAPFATAANALISASQGNVLGAIAGAAGLGGYSDVANAANFAGAVKSGNPLSIISSGANLGGVDLGGVATEAGLGDMSNIGGIDLKDATKAYQAVKAIQSGDPSAIISTIGGYIQDQQNQTPPSSPLDSLVPIPSDRSDTFSGLEEPVDRSIATRPIESSIDDVINPSDIPSIGGDPMDLLPQLPDLPQAPATGQTQDLSDKSFGSAFAQARASGAKEFLWKDNVYNTNLAPAREKMNAGPIGTRTINTSSGMSPDALAGWGGSNVDPNFIKAAAPYLGWDPSTYFPKVDIKMAAPTHALGNVPEYDYKKNEQSYLNIAPYLTGIANKYNDPALPADVLSHELAHVGTKLASKPEEDASKLYLRMANQAGMSINDTFNRPSDVTIFNNNLNKSADYINKNYGVTSGNYLDNPKASLFEKMADLAAIEMQTGKDLTQDPVLKETLFKDPKAVAMYNAMTIPRMSRLDPRDLPPGKVTTSDFPKGQVPLEFRIKNAIRGGR